MKYLFGPVPSRRLGISLGVDLVPHKVCSLNCVYCEVGRTTLLTTERKEYIPISEVLQELNEYLLQKPELDYITFSGQGEPTLNSGMGKVIDFIKTDYPQYKIAVITNGTLFWDEKVRQEVRNADVILPSLDAVSDLMFYKINRPAKGLDNSRIIEGLSELRKEFSGKIFLEIFLVPSLNDTEEEIGLLREAVQEINPDLIQLNTLDRPGTEAFVNAVSSEKMLQIKKMFEPLPVEIIAKAEIRKTIPGYKDKIEEFILETIKRRPCTEQDLIKILNIHPNELNKYLSGMINTGKVYSERLERGIFFKYCHKD